MGYKLPRSNSVDSGWFAHRVSGGCKSLSLGCASSGMGEIFSIHSIKNLIILVVNIKYLQVEA